MVNDIALGFIAACALVTACYAGLSYYVLRDILKKTGAYIVIVPKWEEDHEKIQQTESVH